MSSAAYIELELQGKTEDARIAISTLLAAAIFAAAVISATAGGPANQPVPAPGNHNETLVLGTGTKR